MERGEHKDAVQIMELAFESFSKVDSQWLNLLDNHGFCALDIVWCYYLDQDLNNLSTAGQMLKVAEVCLERAHGKDLSRYATTYNI